MEFFWWLVIIIIVILVGIIVFVVASLDYQSKAYNSAVTLTSLSSPVGFLYRCSNFTCDTGLSCDSVYGVCKYNNGTPCTQGSQCLNGGVCSGVCVPGPPASVTLQPDDPCPCPENMVCSNKMAGSTELSCKLQSGASCTSNGQCFSGNCLANGTCASGRPDGSACTADNQCLENLSHCSNGFCQPDVIETGQVGAACNSPNVPGCSTGLSCILGMCQFPQSALGESCLFTSSGSGCAEPLSCHSAANENVCTADASSGCSCQNSFEPTTGFSRPNPNGCSPGGNCIQNYTCNNNNCLAGLAQPCVISANCTSANCMTGGAIFQAVFEYFDSISGTNQTTTDPTLILGSFNVNWQRISSGYQPLNASKLTVTSDQIFYCVPGDQGNSNGTGLIKLDGTNAISGYFSQVNAGVIDQFLFIDAVVWTQNAAIVALVAFTQIRTNGSSVTQNDVLYFASGTSLVPFNVTSGAGLDGTQYTGSTPLSIAQIDRSDNGDILILDRSSVVYTKTATGTLYSKAGLSGVSSPKFYSNGPTGTVNPLINNISYVGTYIQPGTNYNLGKIVQFTGQIQGALFPVYITSGITPDQYNVVDQAPSDGSSLILVAQNQANGRYNVFVAPNGSLQPLPGWVGAESRVAASLNSFYLYSSSVCG